MYVQCSKYINGHFNTEKEQEYELTHKMYGDVNETTLCNFNLKFVKGNFL